jgi:outer membrane immunogenic protein
MNKSIIASVGSVFLSLLSPALAADFPFKGQPAPYIAPYYNWTGFYIGINGGYGWDDSQWSFGAFNTGNFNVSGAVVGGTIGYNIQFGAFVWGVEGDIAWSSIKGSTTAAFCGVTCRTENQWLGTARLRVGYAFDRWLPYITGGGAFGDIKASSPLGVSTSTEFGWTAGGGIEWAFLGNWTAKVEYLYVDLDSGSCTGACSALPIAVSFKTNLVRGGINYRF